MLIAVVVSNDEAETPVAVAWMVTVSLMPAVAADGMVTLMLTVACPKLGNEIRVGWSVVDQLLPLALKVMLSVMLPVLVTVRV